MTRFTTLRQLITRAREAEAALLRNQEARTARLCEAEECRAKADWLSGRITEAEYWARRAECLDAQNHPVEDTRPVAGACEAAGDPIPY